MAKRKQPKRRKRRAGKIIFVFEILILLVLVAGLFVYATMNKKLDKVEQETLDLDQVEVNEVAVNNTTLKGYQNIMLVGVDSRDGGLDYNNSDVMMIASINNDTKDVKLVSIYRDTLLNTGKNSDGNAEYKKANYAYAAGGAERLLSMINMNFDLNISEYVTVDFNAVAEVVDLLGGLDVTMLAQEVTHMNNYCVETSEVTGKSYERLPEEDGTYHLNGVQAVAYSRIRYTAGNDFKRAQRQRLILEKMVEKVKSTSLSTLNDIMDTVFPMVKTSFTKSELIKMGSAMLDYSIGDTTGFPFDHIEIETLNGEKNDCVVPVTMANNVIQLHQFLFADEAYTVSETCQEYSNEIANMTGYGRDSIEIAAQNADSALPNIGSEADTQ